MARVRRALGVLRGLIAPVRNAVGPGAAVVGHREVAAPVRSFGSRARRVDARAGVLRVLSINVAHGRADRFHQLLQSATHRHRTLGRIADVLGRERPDVVGLQEADGPSFWSGGFCHVDRLARLGGFAFAAHGTHVDRGVLRYGTGLLSNVELHAPLAVTFGPSPPTPAKGFTVGTAKLGSGREVDVASVHLDFLRPSVRAQQIRSMIDVLAPRGRVRPLVVMGDFNAGWNEPGSAVRRLCEDLDLVTHEPALPDSLAHVHTFPRDGARLDWILASAPLRLERYRVLPDVISDHRAVVADVCVREEA